MSKAFHTRATTGLNKVRTGLKRTVFAITYFYFYRPSRISFSSTRERMRNLILIILISFIPIQGVVGAYQIYFVQLKCNLQDIVQYLN